MKPLNLKALTADEAEAEIEWILEAKAEGYTWKQLASLYRVSVPTLKKEILNHRRRERETDTL